MERLKRNILSCIACVILLLFSNITVSSSTQYHISEVADSIHVSLLTCSPHPEVYSLYGHTAIRYQNEAEGIDYVINYGVFDFSDKWFVPKFTFGITDYSMGIVPYYYFEDEYRRCGSSITQQEINLSTPEKIALTAALQKNYEPANRVYRYNYFYKNCSTMARDIIVRSINGTVVYPESHGNISFRDMIHECNNDYPWARLGNDMLLGVKADLNTTTEERQFLPLNLMNDFEGAVIEKDGDRRPLVKSTKIILEAGTQVEMEGFSITPLMCSAILMIVCLIVVFYERLRHCMTLWFDALMMTMSGLAGLVILLMFFSEHPTTSTNLLIVMLNPLPLFFLRNIYVKSRLELTCVWWKIWAAMNILTLFLALVQDFDPSMIVIAAIMLIRSVQHIHAEGIKKEIKK